MKPCTVITECAIEHNNKFLIITRPSGSHGQGLLSFPGDNIEISDTKNTSDVIKTQSNEKSKKRLA